MFTAYNPEPEKQQPVPKKKEANVNDFIRNLIKLSAYVHQLQVQSHLMHFNYEAGNFLGVHAFLKDQYEGTVIGKMVP